MDNLPVQLARRGFLRLISAIPAALAVFRSLPVQAAPVSELLTARIERSIERRRQLGQRSGSVVVSYAGFNRILTELGAKYGSGMGLYVCGVIVIRIPELRGDDYWVTERGLLDPRQTGRLTDIEEADVWVTPEQLSALEDAHTADQRWMTRDGGFRFGPTPNGPTYREVRS